jgi:hypothetical protein
VTCPSEKGPQNINFLSPDQTDYEGGGVKEKMLVIFLIELRSSSSAMLLTGLSQHSRFDAVKTMQSNCDTGIVCSRQKAN